MVSDAIKGFFAIIVIPLIISLIYLWAKKREEKYWKEHPEEYKKYLEKQEMKETKRKERIKIQEEEERKKEERKKELEGIEEEAYAAEKGKRKAQQDMINKEEYHRRDHSLISASGFGRRTKNQFKGSL